MKIARGTLTHMVLLFALLIAAVAFSGSKHPVRVTLQHAVFDEFNKSNQRLRSENIVIVDIDEKSLEELGQWPWSRDILAQLVTSLHAKGAKAIAFDGVFAEKDKDDFDKDFAQAIKQSKIFITAFTYGREDRSQTTPLSKNKLLARSDVKKVFLQEASKFNAAAVNLPELSKAAAGNGSFMAKPDPDGVIRRAAMVFSNEKQLYPSLSLEALRVAMMGRKGAIKVAAVPKSKREIIDTNYRISIGEMSIPIESNAEIYIHYRHFCNEQDVRNMPAVCPKADYVPAYKFLNENYDQETSQAVKDKIILIGASAEGLKDLRSTALRPFRPGVEVHANVIEQILQNDYLLRPSITEGVEAIFILGVGTFFIIVAPFVGISISVILCASIIGLALFTAYLSYVEYGLLIDPVYPSLAVLVIFMASTILSYMRAETRRKQIRGAFQMYVAPDVMRDLERNPKKLKLGGENRELTIMFTDIRKFTSISEGLSPEELITLMNDFLTSMTDIVMQHEGTVDKYIGDAMMSFWNAPRDVSLHAQEACSAALKMQAALEPINVKVQERAKELGKEPIALQVGIGINTGDCAVGNMGSKQRFAYSALGDAVNLASRLEGQTKMYGVSIIIGEETMSQAKGVAILELDLIKVIGKKQTTRIYALLGDQKMLEDKHFREWKAAHDEMLRSYRVQNFTKAKETARELMGNHPALYGAFIERIESLEKLSLPKDWDGVHIAQTK